MLYGCLYEGFKKESEECVEEVQEDAVPPTTHGATQLTIGSGSQATPLPHNAFNKGKGHMEPPSTSTVPTPSPMLATTPPMAPPTSSMAATTPLVAPSSMEATTSSLPHTTSFVAESSLGRESWERRRIARSVGMY